MKRREIILFLSIIMAGVIVTGQFAASANGIGITEELTTQAEQEDSAEPEVHEDSSSEIPTETAGDNMGEMVEEKTENGKLDGGGKEAEEEKAVTEKPEDTGVVHSDEGENNNVADQVEDDTEKQKEDEEVVSGSLYEKGLIYYLNRYQYDCEIVYLQSYLEYVKLEVAACEEMYNMGEMTAADVKSYQAQQASIEAQIKVAKNQSNYNNLFLKENNLDYNDYVIQEAKNVENIDYYIEQYPAKNHMTMAGYVTSYNNALAYIEAKKMEIESLTMKMDSAKLLYEAGELSKLELKQQEAALAKAQYELEQYYVEMNLAYINLITYCK